MKLLYPDEWILIGNPINKDGELFGEVLIHHLDKKTIVTEANNKRASIEATKTVLRYTGNQTKIGKWLKFIPYN